MQLLYPQVKCAGRIVAVHLIGRFFAWVQWVLGGTFMGNAWKRSFSKNLSRHAGFAHEIIVKVCSIPQIFPSSTASQFLLSLAVFLLSEGRGEICKYQRSSEIEKL